MNPELFQFNWNRSQAATAARRSSGAPAQARTLGSAAVSEMNPERFRSERNRSGLTPANSAPLPSTTPRNRESKQLERFRFDRNRSGFILLTAADPRVRAGAGAPDDRRAAVAA